MYSTYEHTYTRNRAKREREKAKEDVGIYYCRETKRPEPIARISDGDGCILMTSQPISDIFKLNVRTADF